MHYQHRFRVHAPVEAVAAFHADPATMAAITPPPIVVQVHRAPGQIEDGSGMDFTLWMGPLPVRWQAEFDQVDAAGFRDRQLSGPFSRWEHTHRFVPAGPGHTDVLDTLEIELRRHWLWGPLGWAMARSLPLLFAYRGWQTRRLLAGAERWPLPALAAGLAAGVAGIAWLARRISRS